MLVESDSPFVDISIMPGRWSVGPAEGSNRQRTGTWIYAPGREAAFDCVIHAHHIQNSAEWALTPCRLSLSSVLLICLVQQLDLVHRNVRTESQKRRSFLLDNMLRLW